MPVLLLILALFFPGCAGRSIKTQTPPPLPEVSLQEQMEDHIQGIWEAGPIGKATHIARFEKNGSLVFQNGLERYNPGRWNVDADRKELTLTFPAASLEAMQIFQMYLGQGIKEFHPYERRIVYPMTPETWTLNIAGWDYTKHDPATQPAAAPPEPVIH